MARLSDEVVEETGRLLAKLSAQYRFESPDSIHSSGVSGDGSPQWAPEFERWVGAGRAPERRLHVTRAMRRLRSVAVREFEVVYRVMVLGERVEDTTVWLNQRAERNRIPLPEGRSRHYRVRDTVCILYSGLDKMHRLWP